MLMPRARPTPPAANIRVAGAVPVKRLEHRANQVEPGKPAAPSIRTAGADPRETSTYRAPASWSRCAPATMPATASFAA
jgi:hypothetical protein